MAEGRVFFHADQNGRQCFHGAEYVSPRLCAKWQNASLIIVQQLYVGLRCSEILAICARNAQERNVQVPHAHLRSKCRQSAFGKSILPRDWIGSNVDYLLETLLHNEIQKSVNGLPFVAKGIYAKRRKPWFGSRRRDQLAAIAPESKSWIQIVDLPQQLML